VKIGKLGEMLTSGVRPLDSSFGLGVIGEIGLEMVESDGTLKLTRGCQAVIFSIIRLEQYKKVQLPLWNVIGLV